MKANFIPFSTALDSRGIEIGDRSRLVAVIAAFAAAITSQLPSSAVDSPAGHYVLNVAPRVNNILTEFNENMVFNLQSAMEVARAFWLVRYTAAHPNIYALFDQQCDVFQILSGVSLHVSQDLREFANKHKSVIVHMIPSAVELVEQITKMEV